MLKYLQAAQFIMDQIRQGELNPNDRLPTENELIKTLNMSRKSIRNGMNYLENQGTIRTVQGSGSYVAAQPRKETVSNSIAVITVFMDEYIFPEKINGLYDVFSSGSCYLSLFSTQNRIESENRILHGLQDGNFAGIILEATKSALPRADAAIFRKLQEKMPILMMDSTYKELNLPSVAMDDTAGGEMAVSYLLERGHRNILYFGQIDEQQSLDRFRGYLQALGRRNISFKEDHIFWCTERDAYPEYFEYHRNELMKQLESCSAAFCCNDQSAARLIRFLRENGLSVPDDLSVVSYDDSSIASGELNLTSVVHPKRELGKKAAENMLKLLADRSYDPNYCFTPKLTERGSVKSI